MNEAPATVTTRQEVRRGKVVTLYTMHGREMTLAGWASESMVYESTLKHRLANNIPLDEAVRIPLRTRNPMRYECRGQSMTLSEWAKQPGARGEQTIRDRLKRGLPIEYAIFAPSSDKRGPREPMTLTYIGETRTVSDWARTLSISKQAIYGRLKRGACVEDALFQER